MNICDIKPYKVYKTLLIDNEYNRGMSEQIIEVLEKNSLEIYQTLNIQQAMEIIKKYSLKLYIINISFLVDIMPSIPVGSRVIVLININDMDILNRILNSKDNSLEFIDYFFIPVDQSLLLYRIQFLLNGDNKNIHLLENNLEKFLWDGLLQQENQLHNLIWNENYNHYILTKYSQYIIYFSHIIALLKDIVIVPSTEEMVKKITQLIELQMCFFNCFINFQITGIYPKVYMGKIKYFLLFLMFIGELLKIQHINTKIVLYFFKDNGSFYVRMEMDKYLKAFVERYNKMYLESYHLFHYIQGYLWEHWEKNIIFTENMENIILEFCIQREQDI